MEFNKKQIQEFNDAMDKYDRKDRRRPPKLPTAKALCEMVTVPVAKCVTADDGEITVFPGGMILYVKDGYYTVFHIIEHLKLINGADAYLYRKKDGSWRWDFIFMDIGDKRLLHNKREREKELSLDVILGCDSDKDGYASRKYRQALYDPKADFANSMVDGMFISGVMETLTEEEKLVIYLRFEEDMTYDKIGEVIGKSNATAWNKVEGVLEIFRQELKK